MGRSPSDISDVEATRDVFGAIFSLTDTAAAMAEDWRREEAQTPSGTPAPHGDGDREKEMIHLRTRVRKQTEPSQLPQPVQPSKSAINTISNDGREICHVQEGNRSGDWQKPQAQNIPETFVIIRARTPQHSGNKGVT
jgi:hypothetical protein